ncbi:pimeloyl-ACP methyl ester carboxylesterase [Actinoplanes teichomyceticus]|uniref:Pimeloyl-ACP methyl ester carboxylesterase n=2 Tax=Actinoplanes teichomyceticus TaxID=1867 RepID=A0A561VCM2_ACTTI|nr:pimeloyl-ACP methyl ester carboxylesterase [Actinoplanes teichomyceticus]GIF16618.1 hypothetical protein Ate01nite_66500 [Actinoplanes teichomyceticus]
MLAATLAALCGACGSEPAWGSVQDAAGQRQRVLCAGSTGPAVVLVHGIGDKAGSASFAEVLDALPDDRRVCRYDRPGAGDSPAPSRDGRDAGQLDAELDTVVRAADDQHPVVLVGHSFGSYPVLYYTARHRDRVGGVVLADGVDPGLGLLAALGVPSWSDVAMAKERLDLAAVQAQTATAVTEGREAFRDLPLTVIRRDRNATAAWLSAQQHLAGLSTRGQLTVAAGAGHQIPQDEPAAVADAITRLS